MTRTKTLVGRINYPFSALPKDNGIPGAFSTAQLCSLQHLHNRDRDLHLLSLRMGNDQKSVSIEQARIRSTCSNGNVNVWLHWLYSRGTVLNLSSHVHQHRYDR